VVRVHGVSQAEKIGQKGRAQKSGAMGECREGPDPGSQVENYEQKVKQGRFGPGILRMVVEKFKFHQDDSQRNYIQG
jgi:hypothetical protein